MNVLVTGGCGFIGGRLISRMLRSDPAAVVRVLDNLTEGDPAVLGPSFARVEPGAGVPEDWSGHTLWVGDIRDADRLKAAAHGADVVVHLAASTGVAPSVEDPRFDCDSNVLGTLNALEAARAAGCERFVFASSGAPVGECTPPIHEGVAPRPASPYGASKLAGEGYCSAFFHSFGLPTVALRFSNVYGPGSGHKQSVVARFINRTRRGEPLIVYGDGAQTRDFIFVDDLVDALMRAIRAEGVGGEIFQIATGVETPVSELVDTLCDVLEAHGQPRPPVTHEPARAGDVLRNFADVSKAAERLGWKAETPLRQGLEQTVAWFIRGS